MDCKVNLGMLNSLSRAKKFSKGEIIACDGLDKKMYVVIKGNAGAFLRGKTQNAKPVFTYEPGDFFGESILFLDKLPLYSFMALTDLIVLQINRCSFGGFLRDEPEMTFEIMKALCARSQLAGASPEISCDCFKTELTAPSEQAPVISCAAPDIPPVSAFHPSQGHFSLFPTEHGNYTLPLCNEDRFYLMEKRHTCPYCKNTFKALKVKPSKLVTERTDPDMRVHYKGIEPIYYDIVTCPHCYYSAMEVMFSSPDKFKAELLQELSGLRTEAQIKFGAEMDTYSVFAGYYLALYCAPKSFSKASLAEAKLLLNLSRIYADCHDEQMEQATAKKALDAYLYAYENTDLSEDQLHQLCIVIGNLSFAQNDLETAKRFLFKAKTGRGCPPRLKRLADERLYDIRELESSAKENA